MNDLFGPKERLEISNNASFKIRINCYTKMQKIELFEICVGKACVMIMKSWACVLQPTHPPPQIPMQSLFAIAITYKN
jgi:hypothetical protein